MVRMVAMERQHGMTHKLSNVICVTEIIKDKLFTK